MGHIYKPDFLIIPYPLLEDDEIGAQEAKLYGVVYWFSRLKNEKCTASNVTLAEIVRSSPKSISNSLNKLEERGYILRTYRDKQRRNREEIIPLIAFSKVPAAGGIRKGDPSGSGKVPPTGGTQYTPTGGQNKNKENKKRNENVSVGLKSRTKCRSCAYDELGVEHRLCPWCGEATDITAVLVSRKYFPGKRGGGMQSINNILRQDDGNKNQKPLGMQNH
ncbi:MAG: hypothetical protein RL141_803 [Candidatus Parcubacteria bacterium]|jgi:hypothetical protein